MKEVSLKITNQTKHLDAPQGTKRVLSEEEKFKVAKAAKDFEALMTQMMIKSMNQTTGGMFGDESFGGDVLDTVFESELAKSMSKGKGLGIAEMLYRKIANEELDPAMFIKKSNGVESIKKNKPTESVAPIEIKTLDDSSSRVKPSDKSLQRLDQFESIIEEASKMFGVDEKLLRSVILAESAANHKAVSSAGAKGLMQLMDSTATELGVNNSFDPKQNIQGGAKYLSKMLRQFDGNLELSLAAYNAGPNAVNKHNGVPPYEETKNYISRIKGYLNYFNG